MIEVSHKCLQFQQGLLHQLRFKIKNVSDVTITFRIRCNNNTHYKLEHYMGLIHSHQDFENSIQNFEASVNAIQKYQDMKFSGDQLEIQYAEFLDPLQDLKDFWNSTQSQDHVMIPIEVVDIQQQQKNSILTEQQDKQQQTLQKELQSIKQEYVQTQKSAVEVNYFKKFQNGFTIGKLMIVIPIALFLGVICR